MPDDPIDLEGLLDGFHAKLAASQRKIDPTQVLDGWTADAKGAGRNRNPAPPPPAAPETVSRWRSDSSDVTDVVDLSEVQESLEAENVERERPEIEPSKWPRNPAPRAPLDITDLDEICASAAAVAAESGRAATLPVLAEVQPLHNPRLLSRWAPGAWIGAFKPACEAATEFINTPQGPVVESYPAGTLLALWTPRAGDGSQGPLTSRWPDKALLAATAGSNARAAAGPAMLEVLPPDATVWIGEADADWALVADLVMHHEPKLRRNQIEALRAFAEAERMASFERLNNGYAQPGPGQPVEIKR